MRSPRIAAKSSPCSPQLEKAHVQQRRPNAAKNNKLINFLKNPKIFLMMYSLKNKCRLDMGEGVDILFCLCFVLLFLVQRPFPQFLLIITLPLCRENHSPYLHLALVELPTTVTMALASAWAHSPDGLHHGTHPSGLGDRPRPVDTTQAGLIEVIYGWIVGGGHIELISL